MELAQGGSATGHRRRRGSGSSATSAGPAPTAPSGSPRTPITARRQPPRDRVRAQHGVARGNHIPVEAPHRRQPPGEIHADGRWITRLLGDLASLGHRLGHPRVGDLNRLRRDGHKPAGRTSRPWVSKADSGHSRLALPPQMTAHGVHSRQQSGDRKARAEDLRRRQRAIGSPRLQASPAGPMVRIEPLEPIDRMDPADPT